MQAIILAGGFGTRLQSVVKDVPKPMAPISGKPFLFYLLSYLHRNHFTEIVLSVGYLKEQIQQYFGNNFLGLNIKYAIENEPLGTGGAILNSLQLIDHKNPVVILNGDTFLEVDYQKLMTHHKQRNANFTIVLKELSNCSRYGLVEVDQNNIISDFKEKSGLNQQGLINSGIYVINPEIFFNSSASLISGSGIQAQHGTLYSSKPDPKELKAFSNYNLEKKFSFESDFLSKFTKELKIESFIAENYFIDIGIPEDYQKAAEELPKLIKNKALFLDRDGVINIDYGHVGKIEDFHFIDGIFDLCQKAQNKGYLIIVVTNQAGIAKGKYTEEHFLELTKWMENQFLKQGIKITKTFYCPYHKDAIIEKYRQDSYDRKPNPGMILKAIEEFNIDPRQSIMIGDKESDLMAAKSANIESQYLVSQSASDYFKAIQL